MIREGPMFYSICCQIVKTMGGAEPKRKGPFNNLNSSK